MHQLLQRFSVGKRLSAGFALLLLLSAGITLLSISNLSTLKGKLDSITGEEVAGTQLVSEVHDQTGEIQLALQTLSHAAAAEREQLAADIGTRHQAIAAQLERLSTQARDPAGQAIADQARTLATAAARINQQAVALLLNEQPDQAARLLREQGKPAMAQLAAGIKAYATHEQQLLVANQAEAGQYTTDARNLLLTAAGLLLVIGCVLAYALTRSLTEPLAQAAAAAADLARGKLDGAPLQAGNDETGEVLRAIQSSRQTLLLLIEGIKETGRQHDLGNLSYRPDASQLPGEYRGMCELLDAQMGEYIHAALTAGRLASRYALGDLSEDFPRVPGDKAELMHAMDGVKSAITNISSEILHISQAAVRGDFSVRGDQDQFQYGFRDMICNLNQLMETADGNLGELSQVLRAIAIGDLSAQMSGDYQGVFARMRDDANTTVGNLTRIVTRILEVSEAARRGDFSLRSDEQQYQHGFRDILANLNQLTDTADVSLGELSRVLRAIADGDLTVQMAGEFQGVFAQMRDDANTTVGNLTGIIGRIQQATASINVAANEIASGNADLSRRTEQQAANLEETAASMEEMTSTVRQNAEHAQQANQLAISTAQVASAGGKVACEVVNTMVAIEESSRRIADIISVIDGIAFQTNILALNAAVEAARAGEQGRGFAVVASEVRTLAQRSAAAAKEIKGLIDDSANKVAVGSALVNKAGDTMGEIVTSVQQVTAIIAEISAASLEQSAGIEQVSQTVIAMDEATQQNASLVEEASAAARAMEEQASQLGQAVATFRLNDGTRPALRIPATAQPPAAASRTDANPPAAHKTAARAPLPAHAEEGSQWQAF